MFLLKKYEIDDHVRFIEVTYYGTKDYIQDFSDSGTIQLLQQTVKTLVPYTSYKFHFSGKSACGQILSQTMDAKTKVAGKTLFICRVFI